MKNQKSKIQIKESQNQELEALKKQVEELTNNWKRAVADYRNLEARMTKEKEEWVKFSNAALLLPLLEVLDDLERAAAHLKDNGLNLVIEKFKRVLKGNGVEELKPEGQFNPLMMECVEQVNGAKKDQVVSVEQKGYSLYDRLLRPAKVKVGRG
ncbi:nucleotide exchange factor GrpE [Candidatus Beckwithbacteria bacterium RBG_13_42_9]|uniref:Protein GrpE n=1 Tax=Candidatus Beckwithbacteria bacterium RBG_13_42_9 TaxID=1797457 RepID=A0A1F5E435_9BACT|nr:MAG: nucleotide exchange factor GrpE [Candidatus Beckwithbacteria bacterium RBG_13_42_9]